MSELSDHSISMNVKKSKMDRDMILRDLTLLKKQTAEMESKYTNVLQENRLLWQTLMKSKKQQDAMKQQMKEAMQPVTSEMIIELVGQETYDEYMSLVDNARPAAQ